LLAIGWWLERNGEAIYGTSPCDDPARTNRDGVQVRFTHHGDDRFAIVLDPPATRELHLPCEPPPADGTVSLLGYRGSRPWSPGGTAPDDGIVVDLPIAPAPTPAIALRISPES
jgi:alpha-L-fucosidase